MKRHSNGQWDTSDTLGDVTQELNVPGLQGGHSCHRKCLKSEQNGQRCVCRREEVRAGVAVASLGFRDGLGQEREKWGL